VRPLELIRIIHPGCQAFPSAIHKVPSAIFLTKQ
jgi:hypothetical protein